ncbi:hypothetical protein BH23BAC4_BH23BAC4_12560 [soil metagenome]
MLVQFWERSRDFILTGLMIVISLGVLFSHDSPVLRSARSVSLEMTSGVEGAFAGASRFTSALSQNEALRDESIRLSTEVARLREAAAENQRLRALIAFGDTLDYELMPARVVNKEITDQNNRVVIDVGARQGIVEGMAVIDERGVVGRVVHTSPNYALVMPHQNRLFRVPATLELIRQDGVVSWDGRSHDRLIMDFVPKTEPVVPGQRVVTSTFSGVFPAGIPIGRVDSVFAAPGRNDYVIYLRPASSIAQIDYVYVVLTPPDEEVQELIQRTIARPDARGRVIE